MPMFASGPPSARREISLKSSCISMTIPWAGARIWESGPRSPSVSQVLRLSFLCLDFRAQDGTSHRPRTCWLLRKAADITTRAYLALLSELEDGLGGNVSKMGRVGEQAHGGMGRGLRFRNTG
jgi:hypothetical protein